MEPPAPRGLSGLVGGKRRHEEALTASRAAHAAAAAAWKHQVGRLQNDYAAEVARRDEAERERMTGIETARALHGQECRDRDAAVKQQNERLDTLISGLAFDVPAAITEYVGIVLSNSVYPKFFPVEHDYEFDLATRELTLKVLVPAPDALPSLKEYRYVQARDEIAAAALPQKERKDQYANAIAQTAVRSMHEVFEADRAGKIQLISLTIAVARTDPDTGLPSEVPLLAVAAEREAFSTFDQTNVVPLATLQHLGAVVSKSCFDLAPIDLSKGVRRR